MMGFAYSVFIFHGNSSAAGLRLASSSAHVRYLYGSRPFSFAVSMRLNSTALVRAPPGVLAKRKFFREITNGLMLLSARLLLSSILPSSRNTVNVCHWFFKYVSAFPSSDFGAAVLVFAHANMASRTGFDRS